MIAAVRVILGAFALCLAASAASAQSTVLQGGPWTAGHAPMYAGSGGNWGQPIVQDGGGSGGSNINVVTLGEIGITSRDPSNNYPSVASGNGPYGSHFCMYDAPVTNATGYHYLCLDPNSQGGGLLSYGAGGSASQLPMQTDINGVLSVLGSGGGGSTSLTIGTTPVSGAPAGAFLTSNGTTLEYSIGTPVVAAVPNTYDGYFGVTWTGSGPITLAAQTVGIPPFTQADVGKDIVCSGIGSLENGSYAGVISTVVSGTSLTLTPTPTLTMTAAPQRCAYGNDQSINLQNTFNNGQANGVGAYVPGGIYLANSPLSCQPPAIYNYINSAPPLCELAQGAVLIYAGTSFATNFVQFGSYAGSFPFNGFIRNGLIEGGTIDGNFNVKNCVYVPFFQDVTHTAQVTKNCIHGVQYGDYATHTLLNSSSGGVNELASYHVRDVFDLPVASVTTGANPTVTTTVDNGFTTGRVVFFTSVVGSTNIGLTPYQITVTSARAFTLNNFTATGTFSSGNVSLNMPSMAIDQPIYGVTNTNPAVLTVPSGAVTNGESVFIADISMSNTAGTANCIDGYFTATLITATTFSVPVDATACAAFSSLGYVIPAPNWTGSTNNNPIVDAWIYNDNSTDMQYYGGEADGVRAGVVNNPAVAGYDAKIQFHVFDYFEQGELLTAYYGGGDNNFMGLQVDCPARYGIWLVGPRNTVSTSEMNCAGFAALPNNETSWIRLDNGATANVIGGSIKGGPGQAIKQEVSSPYAKGGQFGNIGGYTRLALVDSYVTYGQPETIGQSGNLQVLASSGAAEITAYGSTGTQNGVCSSNPADTGGYLAAGTGALYLDLTNYTCAYSQTEMIFAPGLITLNVGGAVNGNFTAQGAGTPTLFAQTASAAGQGIVEALNVATGQYGIGIASGVSGSAAALGLYTGTGSASTFTATLMNFTPTLLTFQQPVEFGASASFTANGAVATTMTSLGPTGSHTTIQEWLTVKDSAGTTRYIPAY